MPDDFMERDSMALSERDIPRLRSYQPLQLLFMLRLGRLLRLRQSMTGPSDSAEWLPRLVSKAIYSTYRDCVDLGLDEDARMLFARIATTR